MNFIDQAQQELVGNPTLIPAFPSIGRRVRQLQQSPLASNRARADAYLRGNVSITDQNRMLRDAKWRRRKADAYKKGQTISQPVPDFGGFVPAY